MVKNINIKKSVIAIGNFDGVHKGHQEIFKLGKKIAKKNKKNFGIVTFSPLPSEFFQKERKNIRITLDDIKIDLLKKNKADFVFICNFNKKFSQVTAEKFIENIIVNKLQASHVLVGKNFRFGHQRKGTITLLKKYGVIFNYKVLDIKLSRQKKLKISSTRIRSAIEKGNVELVSQLLGRYWSIKEKVIAGKKLGRSLGFRTANVEIKNNINPKTGVYAVKALVNNKKYSGIANFGVAPTFSRNHKVLEINLFQKIPSFYGKKIEVFFIKRIRDEKKFKNRNLLISQIKKDITKAKKILRP
ncbi:MAG: bifunctional riboflavin kinase/FAD synthetase [Proteobacteria bacterium]|nr:bifunctional riboflavin kinase/FAD synthetase [Pseudomonadota bacterium]